MKIPVCAILFKPDRVFHWALGLRRNTRTYHRGKSARTSRRSIHIRPEPANRVDGRRRREGALPDERGLQHNTENVAVGRTCDGSSSTKG